MPTGWNCSACRTPYATDGEHPPEAATGYAELAVKAGPRTVRTVTQKRSVLNQAQFRGMGSVCVGAMQPIKGRCANGLGQVLIVAPPTGAIHTVPQDGPPGDSPEGPEVAPNSENS
jgi:hypothetical protein